MSDSLAQNILNKKKELDTFISSFQMEYPKIKDDPKKTQKLVNELISKHSELLNTVSVSIGQSHQQKDFFYNKDLQEDYLATTENFLKTSFTTIKIIQKLVTKHGLSNYKTGDKAYYTIQKLINTFSEKESIITFKEQFEKRNFPLTGFNNKFKRMKHKYLNLQLWIGIPLIVLFLGVTFFGEGIMNKPFNGIQLTALKALLSLSFSIVGSSLIEGQVETDWTLKKGLSIRAVGWVAVFLLLYFVNPSNPGEVY